MATKLQGNGHKTAWEALMKLANVESAQNGADFSKNVSNDGVGVYKLCFGFISFCDSYKVFILKSVNGA